MLEEGEWGKMVRLFYHIFYGEGLIIRPGQVYERAKDTRPYAGKNDLNSLWCPR